MRITTMKTLHLFAAAALAAISVQGANARPSDTDLRRLTVDYSDINISTAQGAKAVLQRLHQAAEEVCGPAPDLRAIRQSADYQSCVRRATDEAVKAIGSVTVASVYQGAPQPQVLARR
jgi:UrcA family protein